MKLKTSVTLSEEVIEHIDRLAGKSGNRSEFIEAAVRDFIGRRLRDDQNRRDLQIINRRHQRLNREAEDVTTFQSEQ